MKLLTLLIMTIWEFQSDSLSLAVWVCSYISSSISFWTSFLIHHSVWEDHLFCEHILYDFILKIRQTQWRIRSVDRRLKRFCSSRCLYWYRNCRTFNWFSAVDIRDLSLTLTFETHDSSSFNDERLTQSAESLNTLWVTENDVYKNMTLMTSLSIVFNSFGKNHCCETWRAVSLREKLKSTHSSAENVERSDLNMTASMQSTDETITIELNSMNDSIIVSWVILYSLVFCRECSKNSSHHSPSQCQSVSLN